MAKFGDVKGVELLKALKDRMVGASQRQPDQKPQHRHAARSEVSSTVRPIHCQTCDGLRGQGNPAAYGGSEPSDEEAQEGEVGSGKEERY
jgi:hypothetical protein